MTSSSLRELELQNTITLETVCQLDGTWSKQTGDCNVQCPPLTSPANGYIVNGACQSSPGTICQFKCLENYELVGSSGIICNQSGHWSAPAPQCILRPAARQFSRCPDISSQQFLNGIYQGDCIQATPGSQCVFSCNPSYNLVGKSTLFCTNLGQWDSPLPTCSRAVQCPMLSVLQNGFFKCSSGSVAIGSSCSFSCNQGFRLIGADSITCGSDGRWSAPVPSCQPSTCPPLTSNGMLVGQCNQAVFGANCSVICDECSRPLSRTSAMCLENGEWSNPLAQCERVQCPSLPPQSVGSYSGSCSPGICNEVCTLNCGQNYQAASYQIRCTVNGWEPKSIPQCRRPTCPSLPPIENGQSEGESEAISLKNEGTLTARLNIKYVFYP